MNLQQSTTHVADVSQIFPSTLWRISSMQLHPCKVQMAHQLTEDDPNRRVQFCEVMAE